MVGPGPHVLGGIEFRRMGGEVVHMESRMRDEEVPDLPPPMDQPTIPQQVDPTAEVAQEVTQEGLDIEAREIVSDTGGRGHALAFGRHRQSAADRQAIVAVPVPDARRLALGRPGAADVGDQPKSAFIDGQEMSATSSSVFLSATTRPASIRRGRPRRARPQRRSGFWQLASPAEAGGGQEGCRSLRAPVS
jgi:hypothetical protein